MTKITKREQDRLLKELEARQKANHEKQVDNASQPAGSSMRYYCKMCDGHVISIGESDFSTRIPSHCDLCKEMIACGYSPASQRFLELASDSPPDRPSTAAAERTARRASASPKATPPRKARRTTKRKKR